MAVASASQGRRAPYYGWVIVGLSLVNQGLGYSVWYSFQIFFVALISQFGWQRAETSLAFSLFVIMHSLGGPLFGTLVDRYGPRRIIPLGAAVTALGVALCAFVSSLWQFILAYGLVAGLGLACIGWVPNNAVVSRWFTRRISSAAGVASSGVGIGIVVLLPLLERTIQGASWQAAFLLLAGLLAALLIPANLLLQRGSPTELGLQPDGGFSRQADSGGPAPRRGVPVVVDGAWAAREWTLQHAARTSRFWFLFCATALATFGQQLVVVHQVAFLVDAGQSMAQAAIAAALVGMFAIPFKIGLGLASDRYGRERTFTFGLMANVLALPALGLAAGGDGLWTLWLFGLLSGIGFAALGPITPGITSDLFRGPSFGVIFGTVTASAGLGSALGAWFGGLVYDLTGAYQAAFVCAGAAMLLAIGCCWLAAPRHVRKLVWQ